MHASLHNVGVALACLIPAGVLVGDRGWLLTDEGGE